MRKFRALLPGLGAAALATTLSAQTPSPTPTPTPTVTPAVSTTPSVSPTPTPTIVPHTTPVGQNWTTQDGRAVNGARMARIGDSTWFMTPANDRVVKFTGPIPTPSVTPAAATMTQWQIRPDDQIGANPVDFQFDGDDVWILENGQSQISSINSAIGRLDTTGSSCGAPAGSACLREWIFPSSRPAGFWRSPDGNTMWVAQTAGVLERMYLPDLTVRDFRMSPSVVFAGSMLPGPDGALWVGDFGNNRIVRFEIIDDPLDPHNTTVSATTWTVVDPSLFVLNISDMQFDDDGFLWLVELSGNRVDRFDIHTGELRSYLGFIAPLHLEIVDGLVYVTERTGDLGSVVVLDPKVAPFTAPTAPLTAVPTCASGQQPPGCVNIAFLDRGVSPPLRDTIVTPTTFTPDVAIFPSTDVTASAATTGQLRLQFNKINAHGVTASGGEIWVGSDTNLIRLVPQTIGAASDLTVPVALQRGIPPADLVGVNLVLTNRGGAAMSGTALFQYSPGAFPQPRAFTLNPGQTLEIPDAFVGASTFQSLVTGSVRIQVTTGQAADLVASVRSLLSAGGGSFGTAVVAQPSDGAMGAGATRTLFTGNRTGDASTLGFFTPSGAQAVFQLVAPDGTVRGTRSVSLVNNVLETHNPAASFFGLPAASGDVVRVQVTSGVLQPFVLVQDAKTRDVAAVLPAAASSDSVFPNVSSRTAGPIRIVSSLAISNPDATRAANVSATYYPAGGASPVPAGVVLPPGGSVFYDDPIASLFQAPEGEGAVVLTSDAPAAATIWTASREPVSGAQLAGATAPLDGAASIPSGGGTAFFVQNQAPRHTSLLLFNRGSAGTITLTAFGRPGSELGQISLPIGASTAVRLDNLFEAIGSPAVLGRVRMNPSPGTRIYAQTFTRDVITGDLDFTDARP